MWRWILAPLVALSLAANSPGKVFDNRDPAQPAVSAVLPLAPAAFSTPLPAGIRPEPRGGGGASETVAVDPPLAAPVFERFEISSGGGGGAPDWVEVEYTVDPELDERVRGILAEHGAPLGHVILMDPASGEVFSYVSTDPETFPATRAYPTASLMKVVTAAAALHKEPAVVSRECRYVGSPYRLWKAALHPPRRGGRAEPFWRSLALSNNQCFARLAVHDVGEDLLVAEMRRVGLLEAPAPHHPEGIVEPIGDELDLGNLGSGLAGSFITPLAAARLAAVLASGELVQPYWIGRVRDDRGNLMVVGGRQPPRPVWRRQVADALRELMVNVTERGTARSAFRDREIGRTSWVSAMSAQSKDVRFSPK